MDLKRFFTDKIVVENNIAFLTGKEFYHATKVVRLKVGYKLIICDNSGFDYYCTVESITKDELIAKIDKRVANDTEISTYITLYIGINKDLDTAVQKAVELGVRRIVPFVSQHANLTNINKERLTSIILESSKQCGRAVLAEISDVIQFSEILNEDETILAFYEFERKNRVKDLNINNNDKIGLIIGCEGGFSQEEYKQMQSKGFYVLTLGKRILRVSTAVVSALTLVNEKLGEV